jgi:hypothetical protein
MPESVHDRLKCPKCHGYMEEGALAVNHGLKWKRMTGLHLAEMASHVPNTHAVMRANHLVAYRCHACELVVAAYGRPLEQQRAYAEHRAAQESDDTAPPSEG